MHTSPPSKHNFRSYLVEQIRKLKAALDRGQSVRHTGAAFRNPKGDMLVPLLGRFGRIVVIKTGQQDTTSLSARVSYCRTIQGGKWTIREGERECHEGLTNWM
jgi:hypothetical protein